MLVTGLEFQPQVLGLQLQLKLDRILATARPLIIIDVFMPESLDSKIGSHQHSCCSRSRSLSCTDSLARA